MLRFTLAVFLTLFMPAGVAEELVIFSMPGCRPCAHLKQMLDENPALTRGFKVSRVDITADPDSAKLFNVNSVPVVVLLDDKDREVARSVGYDGKRAFEEWLKNPRDKKTMRKTRL